MPNGPKEPGLSPLGAFMVGGIMQEAMADVMSDLLKRKAEHGRTIIVLLRECEESSKLLAQCLPYLRATDARRLREQVMLNLQRVEAARKAREAADPRV